MYDLNTLEEKKNRIEHLKDLRILVGSIPANMMSYFDARAIGMYLDDIRHDLEAQVRKEEKQLTQIDHGRVALALDKLLKFGGIYPYNTMDNIVCGDGIFYKSIQNDFTEAELKEAQGIIDRQIFREGVRK